MSQDYEAAARSMTAGMLGMKLWVITTKTVIDREKTAPLLQAHLEHQVRLEKEGVMFGAGPLRNPARVDAQRGPPAADHTITDRRYAVLSLVSAT